MTNRGSNLIADIEACRVAPRQCGLWWLGQHGFAVKLGQTVCYLDAFLTALPGRLVPPLLRADEITNADLVLGSHDHADHIDRPAWPAIAAASPQARFIVPQLLRDKVADELGLPGARVLGVDEGRSITVGGVTVTGVPAAHEFLDVDPATGLHPHLGFVLEGPGFCLYHAGDTCLWEGLHALLRRWRLDAALLPINGRDARRLKANCIGNMTYQEAADLAGSLKPGCTIPAHYDMFASNSEDPELFAAYMRVKYPTLSVHVPEHGQRVLLAAQV